MGRGPDRRRSSCAASWALHRLQRRTWAHGHLRRTETATGHRSAVKSCSCSAGCLRMCMPCDTQVMHHRSSPTGQASAAIPHVHATSAVLHSCCRCRAVACAAINGDAACATEPLQACAGPTCNVGEWCIRSQTDVCGCAGLLCCQLLERHNCLDTANKECHSSR
jgi:hypothetical protein